MQSETKLLLTGVFGPYGITDEWAEGLGMQMELLNNQITREQNIHSIRQHYWTLALYLLAENISVPTVVLDFPHWEDFTRELENGYTHVGINFIVPNVLKAKRMTEYIRTNYPEVKIILGGYGTIIPELEQLMPFDALCKGEGVQWLRDYFHEDITAPIRHPIIQNPISQSIYGFSSVPVSSVLMPGLGCKNGCEFCITSHKFGKSYISLLPTGKDLFDACEKIYSAMGAEEFFIMDENFLKNPERAQALLVEMERHHRSFIFEIFSSAEVIKNVGVDFLVRFGVKMIWLGVESKSNSHAKTKGIDMKELVTDLQSHGISVNTSAILFLDHHTEETIKEDIDWTISLGADMTQFMNFTAYPTTALYERFKRDGQIKDLPYRFQSGQGELNWIHPHIPDPKKHMEYTRAAFRKKYETNGSSVLNMAITAVKGYLHAKQDQENRKKDGLAWNAITLHYETNKNGIQEDLFFEQRVKSLQKTALLLRPVLMVNKVFAPNTEARQKVTLAQKLYDEAFGKPGIKDMTLSVGLLGMASRGLIEHRIAKLQGHESVILQPPMQRVEYNILATNPFRIVGKFDIENKRILTKAPEPKNQNPLTWLADRIMDSTHYFTKMVNSVGNYLYNTK